MSTRKSLTDKGSLAVKFRCVLILLALMPALAACTGKDVPTSSLASSNTSTGDSSTAGTAQNSYADVVSRVAPAVVTIRSERRVRAPQQHPFFDDPSLRDFFGDRTPRGQEDEREQRQSGLGSGVIVSPDGYIVTNHHVIDGAQEIKVELFDQKVVDAKIVGTDPPSDLAVLKMEGKDLPVLSLGNSDQVRVGDVVLAIGNPLGIGQTVTSGIISAKGRSTGLSDGSFEDFLQTDAAINRGNSGGALVNTKGELIGINSQILSPSGGNIGIGFAIPSNMARVVLDQLIKAGKVRRGQLGVVVQTVTSDLAAGLGLAETKGVIVSSVQQGSAADRAGLRQGDVITALNGAAINDSNSLRNSIASTQPGTEVTLTILRDGREQQVRATLGELVSTNKTDQPGGGGRGGSEGGKLGVRVEPLTPEMATRLGLGNDAQGLVIVAVDPSGPAADAGLREGDLIVSANRENVRTAADLVAAIQRAGERPLLLLVNRRGQTVFVAVRPRR
jgi:serine protease Do